jgi:hypothetical protein
MGCLDYTYKTAVYPIHEPIAYITSVQNIT